MKWYILQLIPFLFLFSSCSLLNSGTVHVKYSKFKAKIDDVTYENKKEFGDVSMSVRNVQHPKSHGKWAIKLKLSPSIHYEKHTLGTLEYHVKDGVYQKMPDIKARRLSTFANLKLIFHTPIGSFAATGGYGGALSRFDMTGGSSHRTTEISKVDFVYYKFLSRRFFLLMGPRYYKEKYEQVTFAFRIGYYWGKI
jgi:hypothetical protein